MSYTNNLADFSPKHKFFVGIDSDGCAFDSMEIKHKECFIPNVIKYWSLQPVSKYAREAGEFVNLYSKWRGINRWPALMMVFDLLADRAEVQKRNFTPPAAEQVRAFIADPSVPDSNAGLETYLKTHPHPELENALAWSEAVNRTVADIVHGLMPFPYLRESLDFLFAKADMMVVSATPAEALNREWEDADIARYVQVIAGQEQGKKAEHLHQVAVGNYEPTHILMVGDAPGDLKAARANDALFYPVNPGHEEESWQRFCEEGMHKFLAGEYAGNYEQSLITEFEKLLPETPPWKR